MNLFEILFNLIKAKIMPLYHKVRLWFMPDYMKSKMMEKCQRFFPKLLQVKPENEEDYYTIGPWVLSKKLAFTVVTAVGFLCSAYIWLTKPVTANADSPYKTCMYHSLALKFMTEQVRILGKSGYTAYVGEIEKGVVRGKGILYNPEGNIVYDGEFDNNAYNGNGKFYYPNKNLAYQGSFQDNVYDGEGKLYREDGSLRYEGEFEQGYMQGEGKLYDSAQNLIYTGKFQRDRILYQELLGKSTKELSQMYTGSRIIYENENDYCVAIKDINALYFGEDTTNTLEEEVRISGIYVLDTQVLLQGTMVSDIEEVRRLLGSPAYEGNTALSVKDELALNTAIQSQTKEVLFGRADVKLSNIFDDVFEIEEFERDYLAYLYIFEENDIVYTFFCKDSNAGFSFYMME